MVDPGRVTRARQLLAEAERLSDPELATFGASPGISVEGISRRAMIQHIRLAGARYGLQPDIDAYLALADCASLSGLEPAELRALAAFVGGAMDRMATACDSPDAPPAC